MLEEILNLENCLDHTYRFLGWKTIRRKTFGFFSNLLIGTKNRRIVARSMLGINTIWVSLFAGCGSKIARSPLQFSRFEFWRIFLMCTTSPKKGTSYTWFRIFRGKHNNCENARKFKVDIENQRSSINCFPRSVKKQIKYSFMDWVVVSLEGR